MFITVQAEQKQKIQFKKMIGDVQNISVGP